MLSLLKIFSCELQKPLPPTVPTLSHKNHSNGLFGQKKTEVEGGYRTFIVAVIIRTVHRTKVGGGTAG
jgi:hypothetical protein